MAQNIARLGVILGVDTAEFQKGLDFAESKVKAFAASLPMLGVAAGAAFVGMAKHAMDFADAISDTAAATNMSIAGVLKIGDALEMSGGKFEDAGKILEKFNANISSAAMGSQPLQDAFKKAGVGLKELANPDTEVLLNKTVAGIAKLGDIATQTNLKIQLFGKGMRGVDITNFFDIIKEGNGAWEKYADAVSVAADLHDKLSAKATRTTLMFTQAFLPAMNTTFDAMNKAGSAMEDFAYIASEAFKTAIYAGRLFVTVLQTINASVNLVGYLMDDLGHGKFNTLMDRLKEYDAYVGKLRKGDKEFAQQLEHPPKAGGRKPNGSRETELSNEAKKLQEMLNIAKLLSVEFERQGNFSLQQLKTRNAMAGMTNDEKRIQEAINQQLDATSKKIDEITKKREDAVGRGADKSVIKEYDNQIKKVQELGDEFAKTAEKIERESIASQRTFSYGWKKAFDQYKEDSENSGKMAEDMFSSFTNNMNSALDKFVDTGKLSFGDLASSIIKDLIKIQLRMLMMQGISQMFGFFGMGAMGASAGAAGGGAALSTAGFAVAANGGTINQPTIVGENGPELFIPGRSGSVIPNNQLGDAIGGGGGVTYNGPYIANMSAIDTQSATQFLAKNQKAVWAANQNAQRSLPASR